MIQSKHCDLCEHAKRSLKNGLTCGLTNKKPDFKVSCSNIKFSNPFKEYLPELLHEIEQLKKEKASVYFKFTLYCIIGLIIIFRSHLLLEQVFKMELSYSSWRYFKHTLLIYIVGSSFISIAFWHLNKYRKTLKKMKSDKGEIDMVLNNYNIDIEKLLDHE